MCLRVHSECIRNSAGLEYCTFNAGVESSNLSGYTKGLLVQWLRIPDCLSGGESSILS